ncbi:LiaI-LiaF-like domain-containing protein [Sutcliffiella halmapala]|uniref:LiaI-LiaF-like domain-containing protein n=1 Tax=Sutcliffiella halmapala TaxID=79882 RepID=UPI000994A443|nr:DUF5668 domain-containing protein [Sutcliffiella halmapala]
MEKGKVFSGLLLIFMGIVFLLQTLGVFVISWGHFWPLFILVPGIIFHLSFFLSGAQKSMAGLLVPGGILVIIGLLFFFEIATSWSYSHATWPIYLFAVAFGLFELWFFGTREVGLLIPVLILTVLGVFFIIEQFIAFPIQHLWPLILIVVGLYLLIGKNRREGA